MPRDVDVLPIATAVVLVCGFEVGFHDEHAAFTAETSDGCGTVLDFEVSESSGFRVVAVVRVEVGGCDVGVDPDYFVDHLAWCMGSTRVPFWRFAEVDEELVRFEYAFEAAEEWYPPPGGC